MTISKMRINILNVINCNQLCDLFFIQRFILQFILKSSKTKKFSPTIQQITNKSHDLFFSSENINLDNKRKKSKAGGKLRSSFSKSLHCLNNNLNTL